MFNKKLTKDASIIYRLYEKIQELQENHQDMTTDEIFEELDWMYKKARKISNKKQRKALTDAITQFRSAINATLAGDLDTAEEYLEKMTDIKDEVIRH